MKRVSFASLFITREAALSPALVIDCHSNIIYHLDWIVCVCVCSQQTCGLFWRLPPTIICTAWQEDQGDLQSAGLQPCRPATFPLSTFCSVRYARPTPTASYARGGENRGAADKNYCVVVWILGGWGGGGLCEKFKDSLFIGWAIFRIGT